MRLFKDKELEARLDRLEKLVDKLVKQKKKPKDTTEAERVERIEKSFQKLFNYNEDIATRGYKNDGQ